MRFAAKSMVEKEEENKDVMVLRFWQKRIVVKWTR